jgi:CubicO group peptidase (beta-lactamase class C family)
MRSIFSWVLAFLAGCAGEAPAALVEPPPAKSANTMDTLSTRLNAFDTHLEEMREKLRIPALALVIVKDGDIVYLKGKGYRNLEERLPATEDTLFAIGSTTKAFTALLVLMAVEEGKFALEDSPRKCLPYFSLKDPEADRTITLRHLLTHTSGLDRTDLGLFTGKLTKEEVIRLAGRAEPIAKVGKAFHYNNVMYLAAGECVAAVMGKPYPELLRERIFDPLGMKDTNASLAKTLTLPAHAVGYHESGEQRERLPVPRPASSYIAAGAGGINASARDLGQWLRFLLGRGAVDGKRLISEKSFARLWQPYTNSQSMKY